MISEFNTTKNKIKKYQIGQEILKEDVIFFKKIYRKRLPLKELIGEIDIIKDKSDGSNIFYRIVLKYFVNGLKERAIKLKDFNFDLIQKNIKLTPLWNAILLTQKEELKNIKIVREKNNYNFINFKKTVLGAQIFKELGYGSRIKLSKEELEKIKRFLEKIDLQVQIIPGKTDSEKFFNSHKYSKMDFFFFFRGD